MKIKGLLVSALVVGLMISPSPSWAYREFVDNGAGCTESVYENGEISYTLSLPITIHVDGKYVPTDVDPTIQNGRTMVPLRAAGEALGATISWNQATQTASASKDGRNVEFILNSSTYYINGQAYYTDVVPTIINGRTLLPIRMFAEALNTDVNWDQNLYDVDIDTPAMDAKEPTIPENATQETQKFIKKYYVANDSSDPLVGSWRNHSTSKTGSETITSDNYIFVSKYNDGYHVITFSCEDSSLRNLDSLLVNRPKNGLVYDNSKGSYKIDDNLEGNSTVYYRGPNRGFSVGYSTYKIIDQKLTLVGTYDLFSNMYISQQIEFYPMTSPVEGNINVYAGPGDNYVLTGKISEDDIDKYVKEEGDWIEVEYGKRRGYVQESELSKFDKSNLPYVSNSFVSGPTFRPTIVYFDGYTRQLTDNVSVYSGPSNSYSFQDTVAKDTTVTILHESTNSNSALDKLNPILLIEYNTSNGLKRGYAYKNDVLDLDNPLRGFDHVKKNNAAFSYNGKIYYSTAAYSHALDGWNKIYSDLDSDFQFDFINAVTGVISSNSGSPSLQQEVWLYDAKADANVSVVPGESGAKSMAILDLIMMAGDFVASGSDVFSIQFDLETCDNEGRLLIRTGSPLESPYAGKENVVLSTLLMSQYPGNAREKADEMIRDICPEITGSEKCDLRMNFSDDFDIDSFGYSLIIDKNGKVYAQTIIHSGTEFKIYQGNKYIGDLAIRLSNSLVELDDSTAERVFKILANNGIIRQ